MDALTCLTTRRSVRRYRPEPVPAAQLETILEAGRQAPTANNLQPWHFVTVTDPQRRRELRDLMPKNAPFLDTAGAAIVILAEADAKYYLEDGAAAATAMLCAAHALGLGGCWIAGDRKPYAAEVARWLGAPATVKLIATLVIGQPDGPLPAVEKKPLAQLWHRETF